MKFEVGKQYQHKRSGSRVTYIGPSAAKHGAVYETEYGNYDCDDWTELEVIREPRRFWLLANRLAASDGFPEHIFDDASEAHRAAIKWCCEVIPVKEVLPDEDSSL